MISEVRPSAFNCGTAPSEKPVSSTRCALMTSEPADLQIAGEIEHGTAIEDGAPGLVSGEVWHTVDAEALIDAVERLGRHEAADHAFAIIGLEAVDAHVLGRQPVPDRQQQAGDDVKGALGEFRDAGAFRFPQRRESVPCGRAPVRASEPLDADRLAAHRPDQTGADFDVAVVVHQAGGLHLHGGALGLLVDQETATWARRASASTRGRGGCGRLRRTR